MNSNFDISVVLKKEIEKIIINLVGKNVDFTIEHPSDIKNGDYASNAALVIAKYLNKNPKDIAKQIVSEIDKKIEGIEKIEIAGAGFINFYLTRDFFIDSIKLANEKGDKWGSNDRLKNEQILIEYTSPNLFKPLHVGNLVGNIVGESISRIFQFCGSDLIRINYPSDIGLTVAKGVWGLKDMDGDASDINILGRAYQRGNEEYETKEKSKKEIEEINRALYKGDDKELNALRQKGVETSHKSLNSLIQKLGTKFDMEVFESEVGNKGKEIVLKNIDNNIFEKDDGAVIFRGEKYGLHTRVFINSQGLPTYEAKDIGNFYQKQKAYPDWTKSMIVTGNEQKEYFRVIEEAIKQIFPNAKTKELIHISTGFLTLTTGKMSSRKGNILSGESILADLEKSVSKYTEKSKLDDTESTNTEIAVAALKYQILRQSVGSDIVFDKERALSFEGDSGPYLQYTHARLVSVIKKAEGLGINNLDIVPPTTIYMIEKLIYKFPKIIENVLETKSPHILCTYLIELASEFNSFYTNEKIADESDKHTPYKLLIAKAVRNTVKNGLSLLGIKSPNQV